jgi:hypothetical protein
MDAAAAAPAPGGNPQAHVASHPSLQQMQQLLQQQLLSPAQLTSLMQHHSLFIQHQQVSSFIRSFI